MTSSHDLYGDPDIYDIVNDSFTPDQIAALWKLAERWDLVDGIWLDPGCGSGRLLAAAETRGARVAGFDREPGMIDYARARLGPDTHLVVADLEKFASHFEPQSIAFAFSLINTIRHLSSDEALKNHLEEMAKVLRPDGRYVVGISLYEEEGAPIEEDVWQGARGETRVTEIVHGIPQHEERHELILSHLMIERPGHPVEHRDRSFPLRTYTPAEWMEVVGESALRIASISDIFGDSVDGAGEFAGGLPGAGYWLFELASEDADRSA